MALESSFPATAKRSTCSSSGALTGIAGGLRRQGALDRLRGEVLGAGTAHRGARTGDGRGRPFPAQVVAYGDELALAAKDASRSAYPLEDGQGRAMAELWCAPEGRELTLYEADFIEGLALQPPWLLRTPATTSATSSMPAYSRIWTRPRHSALAAAAEAALHSRLLSGLPLRRLLRGGRRLPGHCGAARRQRA